MIIGHERILDFLKKSVRNGRIAHAYLFSGPSYLGKRAVAEEFIKMLNGQIDKINPDILIIEPEIIEKNGIRKELEIGIPQGRKISHQMSLYPYSSPYKIALVDRAEMMTADASNSLLKTLEEPIGKAVLILITSTPQRLLPTIVSRCQLVNFLPVPSDEIEKGLTVEGSTSDYRRSNLRQVRQVIRLANGRPRLAMEYLENPELLKREKEIISQLEKVLKSDLNGRYQYVEGVSKNVPLARRILSTWLFWFRDLILLNADCSNLTLYPESVKYQKSYSILKLKQIIQSIKKTDWLLANPSINARLALEVLMLEI